MFFSSEGINAGRAHFSSKLVFRIVTGSKGIAIDITMSLQPLEYVDCFVDAPNFRETIAQYEKELEANSTHVKNMVKECRSMITATEGEFRPGETAILVTHICQDLVAHGSTLIVATLMHVP